MRINKVSSSKSIKLVVGAECRAADGSGTVIITDWKGKATFNYFTAEDIKKAKAVGKPPQFAPLAFQLRKAKLILANIDSIKAFVAANDTEE